MSLLCFPTISLTHSIVGFPRWEQDCSCRHEGGRPRENWLRPSGAPFFSGGGRSKRDG